ncbi:MAG: hypothetical protein ACK4N5_00445 [Myxococcales bacterium]
MQTWYVSGRRGTANANLVPLDDEASARRETIANANLVRVRPGGRFEGAGQSSDATNDQWRPLDRELKPEERAR